MIRIIEKRYYFWILDLIGILVFGIRNMQLMHPLFAPREPLGLQSEPANIETASASVPNLTVPVLPFCNAFKNGQRTLLQKARQ